MSGIRTSIAMLAALVLPALATGAGHAAENTPPVLSNFSVAPQTLTHLGGDVVIEVDASDDTAVVSVGATVYFADGSLMGVSLVPVDPPQPDRYTATVIVPANSSDQAVSHAVEVAATDDQGQTTQEVLGWIDVDGQPQFDESPDAFDVVVDPTLVPSAGGPVTVAASATDDRAVSEVYAVITGSAGADVVPLGGVSSSRFEGVWDAPANNGDVEVSYSVEVTAMDDIGQSDTEPGGEITVAARPQTFSRLSVSARSVTFGPVRAGKGVRRGVVLRNHGSEPVSCTMRLPGHRFRVVGAGGPVLTLEPGRARRLVVAYRSRSVGQHRSRLRFVRSDGRQPRLVVLLKGSSTRRP